MVFISYIRTTSEVQFHAPVGLPSGNIPGINWIGTWVDYRTCSKDGDENRDSSISIHIQTTFIIHFRTSFLFPCFGSRWMARDFSLSSLPRSHSDTPNSVRLLWTSDRPVAVTSTWQHTTLTTERHSWSWRDSNPQSQHVSGGRPTP